MVEQYPTPPDAHRASASAARRVVVLLAALSVCGLTARLGLWQLDRAAQKTDLHARQLERRALPPLEAAAWPATASAADPLTERSLTLQGEWLAAGTVYLDNRQMQARPGFYVTTPMTLADGRVVVVQRGWVPRDAQDRLRLPPLQTPAGPQTVHGRLVSAPSRLYDFGDAGQGLIRQNLDLDAHGRALGVRLEPWSVQQTDPVTAGEAPLLRDWPEPAVDVAKHHGYAAQWFALSALCAGLYVWFQLLRPRLRRGLRDADTARGGR
jgi:surfeit locus 1 family protein